MLNIKNILLTIIAVSIIATPAESFSLNFLKRGFKHCTGVCDNVKACDDQDKMEWCILNCSHKMDTKKLCGAERLKKYVADLNTNKDKLTPKDRELIDKLQNFSVPAPTDTPKPPVLSKK